MGHLSNGKFVNSAPCRGKLFMILYVLIYVSCYDSIGYTTPMTSGRAIHLEGIQIHFLSMWNTVFPSFCVRVINKKFLQVTQETFSPRKIIIQLINEMGKLSAELLPILDIILRNIQVNIIVFREVLLCCKMDNVQLQLK